MRGIRVWRGDRPVLAGVSFAAAAGDCVHVLGPNGSGKTTLLRVLVGLVLPEEGSVAWRGRDASAQRDDWSAGLSYLAHSDGLKSELTAHENLAFDVGLRRRVSDAEIRDALAQVGIAAGDQPAGFLSAGQRRRLAMARVLLTAAPLWVLDEPYTNLDGAGAASVSGMIARHLDAGGAAIIAAHQPPAIPGHSPRCVELA